MVWLYLVLLGLIALKKVCRGSETVPSVLQVVNIASSQFQLIMHCNTYTQLVVLHVFTIHDILSILSPYL